MVFMGIFILNGVINLLFVESEIKEIVIKRSMKVFLLVDYIKFDKYVMIIYC